MKKGIISTERNDNTLLIKYSDKTLKEFLINQENEALLIKVEEIIEKLNRKDKIITKQQNKAGIKSAAFMLLAYALMINKEATIYETLGMISVICAQFSLIEGMIISSKHTEVSIARTNVASNLEDIMEIITKKISKESAKSLIEEIDLKIEYSEAEKTFRRIYLKQDELLEIITKIKEGRYNSSEEIDKQKVFVKKSNTTTY